MFRTPQEAAEALFGAIPHAVTSAMLEEYGIQAESEQVQQITRELLSLSLFRIHWALQAVLPPRQSEQVLAELRQRIRAGWSSDLALDGTDPDDYFADADERAQSYNRSMQRGAGAVDMANEAAALLASNSGVQPANRSKVLGLIIDLVPDEELVELAEEIRLTG